MYEQWTTSEKKITYLYRNDFKLIILCKYKNLFKFKMKCINMHPIKLILK